MTVAARAVTAYYGVFPTAKASVTVNAVEDRAGVLNGTTYGGDPPRTRMGVGQHTTNRQLENDWTMTHEFVHLAFPDMTRQHHWLEEGQATYIEPIARAQIGTLTPERVWGDMMRDMHQGLPGAERPRPRFHAHMGPHLLGRRAVLPAGGCGDSRAHRQPRRPATGFARGASGGRKHRIRLAHRRSASTADKAVKVPVMTELYNQMKDKPFAPDLSELWQRLGVEQVEGHVRFRDDAPLAEVRKAITRPVS